MTDPELKTHIHNGTDSSQISGGDIKSAPQPKPTTATGGSLTTGGAATFSTADSLILTNAITRINDIETVLRNLGLIL